MPCTPVSEERAAAGRERLQPTRTPCWATQRSQHAESLVWAGRSTMGEPARAWLALYGQMVRVKAQQQLGDEVELAPIQVLLPEELLNLVFARLGPYTLGRAACVCRQWRYLSEHPLHWQAACREAFGACHKDVRACQALVRASFRSSWRRLFLESPHLRYEGLYVSRNTYVRQGVAEWRRERTVHLVTYFRYWRFFPDGTLLYRTSPLTIAKVAKSMARNPSTAGGSKAQLKHEQHVHSGRYVVKGGKVFLVIVYPNSRSTEVRARCAIRGVPHPAACNRLDLEELVSWDRDTATGSSMVHNAPDEDPGGAGSRTAYQRGLSPCVFVPWHGVASSALNLPVREMDFWMPG